MMKNPYLILLLLFLFLKVGCAQSQDTTRPIGIIGFYNVENLFDFTEDPDNTGDDEYLPNAKNQWDEKRYNEKLSHIAKVVADMPGPPDIIGLAEIENRTVLEDLVSHPTLANRKYQIVHFDSPDHRGIDVALIYKQGIFTPFATKQITFNDPKSEKFSTRDILWVKGLYHKDTLHVAVNHWPSRRGGKEDKRIMAAQILRNTIDSVQQVNPDAKIILMGDFNDDPINKSIKKVLNAGNKINKMENGSLYNTSLSTYQKGFGTLFYRGTWNLFDQIIISQSLLNGKHINFYYAPESFQVFAPAWMQIPKGDNKGGPLRTFTRGVYTNGYSDHYPSFISISK